MIYTNTADVQTSWGGSNTTSSWYGAVKFCLIIEFQKIC